jgi:hypothetical protein
MRYAQGAIAVLQQISGGSLEFQAMSRVEGGVDSDDPATDYMSRDANGEGLDAS